MRQVAFHRTKYGPELLLDAAYVRQMPEFIRTTGLAHTLDFHDILLVTRGTGFFLLDGETNHVSPGVVLFTLPGQVRQWRLEGILDGACLFFSSELTADVFSDPRFLDRFSFFSPRRPTAALVLDPPMRRQFLARFASMRREIAGRRSDTADAMRAQLYEILVLLNRCYVAQHGLAATPQPGDVVERYVGLIQRRFARRHRVADYAASLRISPGHLNALCQQRLRISASVLIRERVALEARRLLLYSDLTATQIADRLGFGDPAYFARFFRREVGLTPSRFRMRGTS
jgi:AraC family transcriptional regulator, transcriptional activator of pobA